MLYIANADYEPQPTIPGSQKCNLILPYSIQGGYSGGFVWQDHSSSVQHVGPERRSQVICWECRWCQSMAWGACCIACRAGGKPQDVHAGSQSVASSRWA